MLPPPLYRGLRRVWHQLRGRRPEWEYVPEGWQRARDDPHVRGWDVAGVGERNRAVWPPWTAALAGTGPLGLDYTRSQRVGDTDARRVDVDLPWAHNAVVTYGYVLALTARRRDRLSILDWGGGVGQFLPVTRALLPEVEVEYSVKDVSTLCSLGRELNPEVVFVDGDDWDARRYDLVFSSSAFQFVENWRGTLDRLAHATGTYLLLNRVPVVRVAPSFVVLQRGESYGFATQFLGWFLNQGELLASARSSGLELVREFVMMDETPAAGAPEQAVYRGFLFRPAGPSTSASS